MSNHAHPVSSHAISSACSECLATFPDGNVRGQAREAFESVTHLSRGQIALMPRRPVPLDASAAGQRVLDRALALAAIDR